MTLLACFACLALLSIFTCNDCIGETCDIAACGVYAVTALQRLRNGKGPEVQARMRSASNSGVTCREHGCDRDGKDVDMP
jgi:hypothetical protein